MRSLVRSAGRDLGREVAKRPLDVAGVGGMPRCGVSTVWLVLQAIGAEVNVVVARGDQSNDRLGRKRLIPHGLHGNAPSSPPGCQAYPDAQG